MTHRVHTAQTQRADALGYIQVSHHAVQALTIIFTLVPDVMLRAAASTSMLLPKVESLDRIPETLSTESALTSTQLATMVDARLITACGLLASRMVTARPTPTLTYILE